MWKQPTRASSLKASKKFNPYPFRALPKPVSFWHSGDLKARHPARLNRSPTYMSKMCIL